MSDTMEKTEESALIDAASKALTDAASEVSGEAVDTSNGVFVTREMKTSELLAKYPEAR